MFFCIMVMGLTVCSFFFLQSDDVRVTYLLATAVRSKPEVGADGAFLWMENTTDSQLSLCYEEAQVFSGVHTGFQAVWVLLA